jgi:GT2 family glycosyltransferase
MSETGMSATRRIKAFLKAPFRIPAVSATLLALTSPLPGLSRMRWKILQRLEIESCLSGENPSVGALYRYWLRRYGLAEEEVPGSAGADPGRVRLPHPPRRWTPEKVDPQTSDSVRTTGPVASIIIPTKDRVDLLDRCLSSLYRCNPDSDFEIIVVNNNSTEKETADYLQALRRREGHLVLDYPHPFNYSAINNLAARSAKGKVLVFLNNDTESVAQGWIGRMASRCSEKRTGCVGTLLLYGDGSIQHVGATLGASMGACHFDVGRPADHPGFEGMNLKARETTVVTAACMGISRELFFAAGGFDEAMPVAFNDVELCLRIAGMGRKNLFDPDIVLLHHESKSRGQNDTDAKRIRERKERNHFIAKCSMDIRFDPCYSPDLSLRNSWCLAFPPRIRTAARSEESRQLRRVLFLYRPDGGLTPVDERGLTPVQERGLTPARVRSDLQVLAGKGWTAILGSSSRIPGLPGTRQVFLHNDWDAADFALRHSISCVISCSREYDTIGWNLPADLPVFHLADDSAWPRAFHNPVEEIEVLDGLAAATYGRIIYRIEEFPAAGLGEGGRI